jgi:hypothetical protein
LKKIKELKQNVGLKVLVIHVVLVKIQKYMPMIMMVIGVTTLPLENGVVFLLLMTESMMKFVGLNH